MNEEYLSKLHMEILGIMDVIDAVCRNYNLHYYLTGGTLLGAIRHQGFIPWDDDLDIIMPRSDFNKFIDIASDSLPNGYYLEWITTNSHYYRLFAKVCKRGTLFCEKKSNGDYTSFGIFVDIFPVDDVKCFDNKVVQRKKIVEKIKVMLSAKSNPASFGFLKKVVIQSFSEKQMIRIAERIMRLDNAKGYSWYTNYGSQYTAKQRTIPKEWLGEGCRVKFERRDYVVAEHYDLVLKNIFGERYMQLPPIEKRRTHLPIKVVFSDGTEMSFEESEKMSVKESLEE